MLRRWSRHRYSDRASVELQLLIGLRFCTGRSERIYIVFAWAEVPNPKSRFREASATNSDQLAERMSSVTARTRLASGNVSITSMRLSLQSTLIAKLSRVHSSIRVSSAGSCRHASLH